MACLIAHTFSLLYGPFNGYQLIDLFNYQEYDIQAKIELECKMREGTAKLLAACKHTNQSLEASKSLLTSDIRLTEFRKELQLRKSSQKHK